MKRSRFTPEQIIGILKENEGGVKAGDLARRHGVTEHTIYRWKAKYGGMSVSDAQRLKQLEDENRRLKHIVADQTLDIQALKAVLGKKWLRPPPGAARRASSRTSCISASAGRAG